MSAPRTPHRPPGTAPEPPAPAVAHPADPAIPAPTRAHALDGRRVIVVGAEYGPQDWFPSTGGAPAAGVHGGHHGVGPHPGAGAARYTTAITEHLATRAASVTVLTGVPRHPDGHVPVAYRRGLRTAGPGWYAPDRPQVIRLRRYDPARRHRTSSGRQALHELTFLVNAVSAGRRLAADLVIGITPGPAAAAAAASLARRCGAPLVTVVQGADSAVGPAHGRVHPALERYALRHSTQVAVASECFRARLLAAGVEPHRLHLLPAWARTPDVHLSRTTARRELGWDPAGFVAVHTGPLGHQQDAATLVEAGRLLDDLADDGSVGLPPRILVMGEGPRRTALEQRAFGVRSVRFADAVDDDTVPLVLAAADVLLVSESASAAAGSATASGLLAACLAAGRPVVAVVPEASPTASELRRAGGAGVRVDPGDAMGACRALLDLHPEPGRRASMGHAAARYARAHLGREASLRRLDAIVEAALVPDGTGSC